MSLNDTVNYLLFNNPISQLSISGISGILKMTVSFFFFDVYNVIFYLDAKIK